MPGEQEKAYYLDHGMSDTYAKKEFAGYKYDSLTIQMDQKPIETKSDESIKITGKNKYKAEEYKEPEEGSFKEATVIFYYTPVDVAGTHLLKAEPDSNK